MSSRKARTTKPESRNMDSEPSIFTSRSLKLKICLIGDGAVGKTALRRRFMGEGFKSSYMFTVGADFAVKEIVLNDPQVGEPINVTFQIWDLAGQPKFKEVRRSFYNGAKGALVVFDVTNPQSWHDIPHWIDELWRNNGSGKIPFILVGNKIDLANVVKSPITRKTLNNWKKEFEQQHGMNFPYMETSAKTGENVEEAFHALAKAVRDAIIERSLSR